MQRFETPATGGKFLAEIFEKLRMRRLLAAHAKITDSSHQSLAKMMLPDPIDHHPRQQRPRAMIRIRDPLGQRAALRRRMLRRHGRACSGKIFLRRFAMGENAEKSHVQKLFLGIKITAIEQISFLRLRL